MVDFLFFEFFLGVVGGLERGWSGGMRRWVGEDFLLADGVRDKAWRRQDGCENTPTYKLLLWWVLRRSNVVK